MAYTTPQCPMTGEELASLRNPGDLVTTKEGHTVQLVEDGEGRRLFLSQSSSSVPPTVSLSRNLTDDKRVTRLVVSTAAIEVIELGETFVPEE